jgi:hypothetical protein
LTVQVEGEAVVPVGDDLDVGGPLDRRTDRTGGPASGKTGEQQPKE